MEDVEYNGQDIVLLLGNVDQEGVLSAATHAGFWYKRKVLHSSRDNWLSILNILEKDPVRFVLAQLTGTTYQFIADEDYSNLAEQIFERISSLPHAVFVHQEVYSGPAEEEASDEDSLHENSLREKVNEMLSRYSLDVLEYQKNSDVTLLAVDAIQKAETGLLLRLYVPNKQLWSVETDKFLQLFRDYLTKVAGLNVRLEEVRTSNGVILELRGDPKKHIDLSVAYEDFAGLAAMCVSDPRRAEMLLKSQNIPPLEIARVITRYGKEFRRLQLDVQQEMELKALGIRHRLESELQEQFGNEVSVEEMRQFAVLAIPEYVSTGGVLRSIAPQLTASSAITLNYSPQFIEAVHGIVAQEITGDIDWTESDRELLRLFTKYGEDQHDSLLGVLRELKDKDAPKAGRMQAHQRLRDFLRAAGKRGADVATGLLQAYLQKLMMGP
jgi:hypothetical protein